MGSHPDGQPREASTRRHFLATLSRLGLSAAAAPLVYHMLNTRLSAQSAPGPLDAAQERVTTGQFYFPRLQFQCYSDAPRKKWDISPNGDQILRNHVKSNTNINILAEPVVVSLDHPELLVRYPFVFMTSEGRWRLSPESTANLREYLLRGGFLYADDCCYEQRLDFFFQAWCDEIRRIFPEHVVKPIPVEHEVFHCFYDLKEVPFCQGVHHPAMGLFDRTTGRLMSVCTSGDIHCGWVGFSNFTKEQCAHSLEFGTNLIIYCLTR
jgi:hypothetical protein